MLNVVFMGTPDFARDSLKAVDEAGYNILGVVTNPDRQKGRGMKMIYSPVKEYSLERNFKIYQPEKVKKNTEFINEIKELKPDVICVVAYGKILPKELLDIPKFGCINVHGSLLPKYRGAAPIQWAVINGEKETGVTTILMDEGMDTGDMLLKEKVQIGDDETTGELWNRLSKLGGELLVKTLEQIENNTLTRTKQGDNFTSAPMLNKEMSRIDWNKAAIEIKNLCRGLNPIMGTYTFLDDKKIKIWKMQNSALTEFETKYGKCEAKIPGEIILADEKKGLFIYTKDGIIDVLEIQAENAKRMNIGDFLRGNKIKEGQVLK